MGEECPPASPAVRRAGVMLYMHRHGARPDNVDMVWITKQFHAPLPPPPSPFPFGAPPTPKVVSDQHHACSVLNREV